MPFLDFGEMAPMVKTQFLFVLQMHKIAILIGVIGTMEV